MLVVFPPIFVADAKLIYDYDFVAPLKMAVTLLNCFVHIPISLEFLMNGSANTCLRIFLSKSNVDTTKYYSLVK